MHPMCPDSGEDIFDFINRGDVEQCSRFLQNDPSFLNQKGWGGFTALHYAALHGNRSLVDLFLGAGADPNLACDAGQTAFHFSCRQGNIYIIHQMLHYGADLRLVDLQGTTSLHHAVTGGSIITVHYLWETGMFRFSDTDIYQVTPLHLAASTGNIEMVLYLLKNQRCTVEAVDQQGETALHVAAERGGVEVCWALLQRGGCRMLHQKNLCGRTPLELCKQGKTFRHQQLTKLLSHYIYMPRHYKPTETTGLYYWSILFPGLSATTILLIATVLGGYSGIICSLLFPWLAKSIFSQYYRLTSYQRLPNPIYLGTLLAGLFHSLLCFYGKIAPNAWASSAMVQVSTIHFSVLLGLFCKMLTQDPGVLDSAEADPRFSCIADLVEDNQSPQKFCPYCELIQPSYTKHCKLCDVCIKDYDHHCLFLNRCVGRGNHRLFLFFILFMVTSHLLFVSMATSFLYNKMPVGIGSLSLWLALLEEEFWVVVTIIMNALTVLWEVWILSEQFKAVATGTTIYFRHCEVAVRQRSSREQWKIVLSYLLGGRSRVGWEHIGGDKSSINI